jgi:protein-S-isoprenylcysteine O-methyltransferase Ste14
VTIEVVVLGCWVAVSGALLPLLRHDYSATGVRARTGVLIWIWHLLNYTLLVVFAVEEVWSLGLPSAPRVIGLLLVSLGIAAVAAGFYEFRSMRRLTGSRRDELIESGVYRFSRHPQYLGIIMTLVGGALAGDSGAALLFALALSATFILYLPIEERYVSRALGARYDSYRERVPILLGRPDRR